MASVFKDSKTGKWCAQIVIGTYPNGNKKYKRFNASTKREVLKKIEGFTVLEGDSSVTVATYITKYIDIYKKNSLKPSSLTRDYGILNNQIIPLIGDFSLSELNSMIIQANLINGLVAKGYSHSTIHKAYTLLNEALNKAVQEDRIKKNPCCGVNMPSKTNIKPKQIEVLTEEETKIFFEVSESGRYDNGLAIALILYTGLRVGELCAMKWSDIDFSKRVVTVQRNISVYEDYDDDGNMKRIVELQDGTKTRLKRFIPLNDKAIDILNRMKAKSKSEFLITTRSAIPDVATVSKTYNNMLKYGEIEGKTGIHTLRHTFASTLIKKGIDVKVVSELLGHSSVTFTYNTYIHLFPEQKAAALSVLDY